MRAGSLRIGDVGAKRSGRPKRDSCSVIGAHGRTRTCTSLIRNQELFPVELRVRCWLPDQDSNLDWPVNNRVSCHWTIEEAFGGAPRTRTELNLLAREIRGPCACPDLAWPRGGQTLWLRVHGAWREGSDPANRVVPGVGFEPTSPRLQRGAFTRLASQAKCDGAADGNRTRVCAVAPRGSAIELRTPV
jgi:hypothetical protein